MLVDRHWKAGGGGIIQWVQSFSFARLKNSRDLLQNNVRIFNIIVHLKVKW